MKNERNELIFERIVAGWCICIDYRKLNDATRKDHLPLPLLIKLWNGWPGIHSFVTCMDIWDFFKFSSIQVTKRKSLLHAPTELLLIVECHLDCAMPRPLPGAHACFFCGGFCGDLFVL